MMNRIFQVLAFLPFLSLAASASDTVAGYPDFPGQTGKVAVVEGPVILRKAGNAAVLDAYKGAAGEVMWSAEEPYDWRMHTGDGKPGGWSIWQDYVLPLWRNRWISWDANVADATGELRMHGHPVALNGAWTMHATDILSFSYGTNVVAYLGLPSGSAGGGRILDYGIEGDVHTVTCTYIEGDAARPVLQTTTDLADGAWAAVPDVTTNRIDPSTVALVHTNAGSNAFFRVLWTEGIPSGLTVRGNVTANSYTLDGREIDSWSDLEPDLSPYATTNQVAAIEAALQALSPVILTPDGKKWTAQGRYAGGQVTHVWVPWAGVYSAPIRVPMPDGRIFEMSGRYADGNTNIVTHAWEEVVE